MFYGFVILGQTFKFLYQARTDLRVPVAADALPVCRIYGDDGVMPNGICTMTPFDVANSVGLYQGAIAITGGDGYEAGKKYVTRVIAVISGVQKVETGSFVVT
jgi:hypothetical protein